MSATVGGPRFTVELEQEGTSRQFVAYVLLRTPDGRSERLSAAFVHDSALEAQARARAFAAQYGGPVSD